MILLLDTSTPTCFLVVANNKDRHEYSWEAGRELSKKLLGYIQSTLTEHQIDWGDIAGIGCYKGPGSFTGLRIGLTVCNSLASSLTIPIVGESGKDWQKRSAERLQQGENDRIVMPEYGADAHITAPRK